MKNFRKPFLLLLALVLIGQGLVANALSCQLPSHAQSTASADMAGMDHSAHRMPGAVADTGDSMSSENCCDSGVCSMTHCQSGVTLPLNYLTSRPDFGTVFSRSNAFAAPTRVSDSLYRPPITR